MGGHSLLVVGLGYHGNGDVGIQALIPESDRTFGIVRNDGRSIHHRNELEKVVAAIAGKIDELKFEVDERRLTQAPLQLGGS